MGRRYGVPFYFYEGALLPYCWRGSFSFLLIAKGLKYGVVLQNFSRYS
jgi:hypothetical protein